MATLFTGQLGTPSAMPGNVELAFVPPTVVPSPPNLLPFTGRLGTFLTAPGSIWLAFVPPGTAPLPVSVARIVRLRWNAETVIRLLWSQPVATIENWPMFLGEDVTVISFPETPGGPITNWTLALTVANGAGTVVITKTPVVTNGPNGVFQFTIAHADTSGLPVGVYNYDVSRTDSGADTVLMNGSITLSRRGGGGT